MALIGSLLRGTLSIASRLSPRSTFRLADTFARLNLVCNGQTAQVTRTNLATCFPDLDEDALKARCRASLIHMALLFFEFAQLAHWPEKQLLGQITDVEGKGLADEAYAQGKGVLLLVPHFGNWELLCAYLGAHYQFAALYDPPKVASTGPVILEARQRFEGELYPIDTGGMRSLLRAIRDGKLIAVLPDQVPDRNAGVYAPFFGQPALTMTLVHRLMQSNKATVLMGSVERRLHDAGIDYTLRFEALEETLSGVSPEEAAASINAAIEKVVRRAPEQYQWEYKRFKRPPQLGKFNIYRQ